MAGEASNISEIVLRKDVPICYNRRRGCSRENCDWYGNRKIDGEDKRCSGYTTNEIALWCFWSIGYFTGEDIEESEEFFKKLGN